MNNNLTIKHVTPNGAEVFYAVAEAIYCPDGVIYDLKPVGHSFLRGIAMWGNVRVSVCDAEEGQGYVINEAGAVVEKYDLGIPVKKAAA